LPGKEQIAKLIALQGATDAQIATICNVPITTLRKWRKLYPGFDEAIREGRTACDADVLYAMYKSAIGFEYVEEQAVGGKVAQVLDVKRYAVPNVAAQKHWLKNRQKDLWPDRQEVSGPNGGAIGVTQETRNGLIDSILSLVKSKPDGEEKPKESADAEKRRR
jgi:transposase-like protein